MDGLTIVAGTGSDGQENDIETLGASYTMGNVTVGYQRTEITLASGSGNDETGTHVGASLAINENLSVSVGRQETDFATGTSDEENTGYSASYTMGGMTIGYAFNEAKNVAGNAANRY